MADTESLKVLSTLNMAEQDIHALQAELDINDAIALGLILRQRKKRRRKTCSVWVDAILLDRRIFGSYFHLFPQLSLNDKKSFTNNNLFNFIRGDFNRC